MRFIRIVFWGALIAAVGIYMLSKNEDVNPGESIEAPFEVVNWDDLRGFDAVELRGGYRVVYHQAAESRVEADGPRAARDRIEAQVSGGTLRLAHRKGHQKIDEELTIHLYAPTLRELSVSGAVDLRGEDVLQGEALSLDLSGAGKMALDLAVRTLSADISGAGKYLLRGKAQQAEFSIAGAGDVRAFDLTVETLSLKVAGAGNAEVYANQRLDVTVVGAGKVVYDGNPQEINPRMLGAGALQKRGE